jgi:N-acylglucosamine-6-phosphate 2-epimerase
MHSTPTESQRVRSAKIASLRGAVLASCQAGPGSPLKPSLDARSARPKRRARWCARFSRRRAGKCGAVRAVSDLPIFGINKVDRDGYDVRITSTLERTRWKW